MNANPQTRAASGPDRSAWFATVAAFVLTTAMQWSGGAYQAEFCGAADEPAHVVSSLLVRDYAGSWPLADPMPWAMNYYLHYPKAALGHWPPGYFVLQAGWWLIVPPGRVSAMLFNAATATAAVLLFYLLARRIRSGWPALLFSGLLLVSPLFQQAAGQVMSDLLSLTANLAAILLLARFIERPSNRRLLAIGAAVGGALLIKGTAVVLLPAVALAITADRSWRRFRVAPVMAAGVLAVCLPVALWYRWQNSAGTMELRHWGGVMAPIPWAIGYLPAAAGPGFMAIALGGMALVRRHPAILCAAAGLISFAATSYVVRAFREPRH
ncbi:MAG: glycosyltransferase family 39 protein, partial [Acidobacteria bacterium]|nr:glycosyltransferase family 39 protein [Acidobacteriota bacterium]